MPDDLVAQIEPIHEAVARAGLAGYRDRRHRGRRRDRHPGALGGAARTAHGDLDRRQGPRATGRRARHARQHDEQRNARRRRRARQSSACRRTRIVDYLSLVGEASTTCRAWRRSGRRRRPSGCRRTVRSMRIVARAGEIGGVVGDNLRKALPWLPTARTLVTIRPIATSPLHVPDTRGARCARTRTAASCGIFTAATSSRAWLREIERRRSAADRAGSEPHGRRTRLAVPARDLQYETVLTREQLDAWLQRIGARRADLRRYRDHVAGSDGGAAGRHFAVGGAAARRATSRSRIVTPGRRTSCRWMRRWRAAAVAGEPAPSQAGPAPEVRHARVRQPRHHVWPASRTTRCSSPTCWKRIATMTWTRWQSAISAARRMTFDESAARASVRSRSTRWRSNAPLSMRPRTPRSRWRCITRYGRTSKPNEQAALHLRGASRCRWRRCCSRWSATAC